MHKSEHVVPVEGVCDELIVAAGTTTPWIASGRDAVVSVKPGAGGTMTVEVTNSLPSRIAADNKDGTATVTVQTWKHGAVASLTSDFIELATAVRFKAEGADGVAEVFR